MKMIKKIYILLMKILQELLWKLQIHHYKIDKNMNFVNVENCLIIAPHADDELIGCYTFLKCNKSKVFLCSLTGEKKENKNIREEEFKSFCDCEKIDYIICNNSIENELMDTIERMSPKYIFIPTMVDWHAEHRLVNKILYRILENNLNKPKIVWYQVSVPINEKFANRYVYLDKDTFKEKWGNFIKFYTSQKNINYDRFKFVECHQLNDGITNIYCCINYNEWKQYVEILTKCETELNMMKSEINNLGLIYKNSGHFYQLLNQKK